MSRPWPTLRSRTRCLPQVLDLGAITGFGGRTNRDDGQEDVGAPLRRRSVDRAMETQFTALHALPPNGTPSVAQNRDVQEEDLP
jgi:hypothetical protein